MVAFDLSAGMLAHARPAAARTGIAGSAGAGRRLRDALRRTRFDLAFSAFGAIPFVADSAAAMREVARVLRPGGRWVFAATHPMRWAFPDDPGPAGLTAIQSYFDRSPYVEVDEQGVPAYVEHHRTMGDRIREIVAAGFVLQDVIEPEWPEDFAGTWGQWSPERGEMFPGTAIFVCTLPGCRRGLSPAGRSPAGPALTGRRAESGSPNPGVRPVRAGSAIPCRRRPGA